MKTMGPISSPKRSRSEKQFLTTEPKPRLNTLYETIFLNESQGVSPLKTNPAILLSESERPPPRKPPAYSPPYSVPQVQQRLRSPYPPSIFVT